MFVNHYFILTFISVLYSQCTASHMEDEDISNCNFVTNADSNVNVEQCIDEKLFVLKSDILSKLEPIATVVYEIKKSTDEINKVSTNIIPDETDFPGSENTILKSINMLNNKLDTLEKDLKNTIATKFDTLENNFKKELKDLSETMKSSFANTMELKDKIDLISTGKTVLESTKNINDRLVVLENMISHQEHNIQKLLSITDLTEEPVRQHKMNHTKNKADSDYDVIQTLCHYSKENSLNNIVPFQDPVKDNLDDFLIHKTGCSYTGEGPYKEFLLPEVTFDGTEIEWQVAVRTKDRAFMDLKWSTLDYYGFLVGDYDNTVTRMVLWEDYNILLEQPTKGILSDERYVPFYFKINKDSLKFGKACSNEQLFRRNITINIGQKVQLNLRSHQHKNGAKYLYDCPTTTTNNIMYDT